MDDSVKLVNAGWNGIKNQAQKEWDYLVDVHSSWGEAIDYWSLGTLTEIKDYIEVSKEKPMSVEQWSRAAFIFISAVPSGKNAKVIISPFANDWQTKGFHIMLDGIELSMKPGNNF